jgi:catechol 2,3-dioxygenase-like lactoylglutathione lyase family enzyme
MLIPFANREAYAMTNVTSASPSAVPPWGGIHHIALVTPDLEATIQFYKDVLGMQLLFVAPAGEMHGRHAGLHPGGNFLGLHFFELPTAQIFTPPDLTTMYWLPGALHHISLVLPDEKVAQTFRERLQTYGVAMSEIMDQGNLRNMVFLDNNGILLEAAWSKPENSE